MFGGKNDYTDSEHWLTQQQERKTESSSWSQGPETLWLFHPEQFYLSSSEERTKNVHRAGWESNIFLVHW